MAATNRKSKLGFDFTTTPDSDDAQYARKEMERLTNYLLGLIATLRGQLSSISTGVNYAAQIEQIFSQLTLLQNQLNAISVPNNFLVAQDLFPIIVPQVFTRNITINAGQTAVFFDQTEFNGDITNNGLLLVL